MSECDSFELTPVEAASEVVRVVDVVNTWKLHFAEVGVSPRDIESLVQQSHSSACMVLWSDITSIPLPKG